MKNKKISIDKLKHANVPDSRFDMHELMRGARVEREHTSDPDLAKAIAKAHLIEDKDYYKKLAIIENKNATKKR